MRLTFMLLASEVVCAQFAHTLAHYSTPEKHQIETMPGGVAVIDFDGDGLEDLFFTNGAPQPSLKKNIPADCNRLYKNLGRRVFIDVSAASGLCGTGYDIGAAAADFDGDGRTDLFVAGVRSSALYRNLGGGRFGIEPLPPLEGWVIGGGWFDYDRDGDLDLFVVRYVKWDPAAEPFCGDTTRGLRTYCHPKFYEGLSNVLLRNDGTRGFTDTSPASGIAAHVGKGMAVAFGDVDGDGWLDAFVTNDTTPSFLFRNLGNGKFEEIGDRAGVAYNDDGRALSSMGADFRDIDGDGRDDIFLTALNNETFPFYRNVGKSLFEDRTYPSLVGKATIPFPGWSCGIFDFDNDGRRDLFAAGGDVQTNTDLFSARASRQTNLFLMQKADGTFTPKPAGAAALHRGAAFADFDGDGFIDVVVTRLGERPVMQWGVRNANHWIAFRAPLGTLIRVGQQVNRASTAVGYASSSSALVHFGLGATDTVDVEIVSPGGKTTTMKSLKADRIVDVIAR